MYISTRLWRQLSKPLEFFYILSRLMTQILLIAHGWRKSSLKIAKNLISESKPAYQFLEPRAGYVPGTFEYLISKISFQNQNRPTNFSTNILLFPVYIRFGDTPLSKIHPLLARAFNEPELIEKSINEVEVNDKLSKFWYF